MKLNVLTTAAVLSAALAVRPSLSQTNGKADLNISLKQALCDQNWGRAIEVIDKMKAAAPQRAGELTLYRGQLESFLRTGAKIPNWPEGCAAASVPGTTPATPPTTNTTPATTPTINTAPANPNTTNTTPANPPTTATPPANPNTRGTSTKPTPAPFAPSQRKQ